MRDTHTHPHAVLALFLMCALVRNMRQTPSHCVDLLGHPQVRAVALNQVPLESIPDPLRGQIALVFNHAQVGGVPFVVVLCFLA